MRAAPRQDAIIIGAGPGGLAAAACLRSAGLDVVVLERGEDMATRWRNGYDRLRINTSSWFSHLPGLRFPKRIGRWVARDDLLDYYRDYVAHNQLEIRSGVEVDRLERAEGGWLTETSHGRFESSVVVVATGKQNTPVIPDWPGLDAYKCELIHSSAYRNAGPFQGKRVLVVGSGNSGTDIALDLAHAGAGEVLLSVRRPPHIVRREVWGIPHDAFAVLSRHAPRRALDASARLLRRLTLGDLAEIGLPVPGDGAVTRFEEDGRVPTIDSGAFVEAVRCGQISIVAAIDRLKGDVVVLADGTEIRPEAVIAATGYRPDLQRLVGHLGVLDPGGTPTMHGAEFHPSTPHLYFVGFLDPRSGHLRELRLQAKQIARTISHRGRRRALEARPQCD